MIGVTKLINLLDKPSLVKWANRIGLQGLTLEDYRKKSTSKGSKKHKEIELYLKKGVKFKEYLKLEKILKNYEIIGSEQYLSNDYIHGYADLILKKDNKVLIVDFKSSNKIYLSQKIQLCTYKEICKADEIAIINFTTWELNILDINSKKYYEIVKRLYQVNVLLNELNERL